ncbi:UNVERIFIED_CONTAM: Retrovirus-related Pol polyprotein from transposon TNT 1-94 [Sesamum radiatum]|uniref:Retrovirus-related Pol polyprotein from transposon TNT 1-94 n=1 Tax=Sesamum radiatum TaxID=300843 RepID=A0AAW2RF53_SESRA
MLRQHIDSTFPWPAFGSAKFEQWRRADLMVTSWLWNSISKEIVEAFMYASSSRELWLELQARYERSNGPMVYQIQWEISSISQGEMSLTAYLTKAKKLWNELTCLAPSPKCTCGGCSCGINKAINDMNASTQLMQFLMGLHESFDKEKSQVLMMDPLADLEKAYSMILGVEKQRSMQVNLTDSANHAAFQLSFKDNRREGADRQLQKRRPYVDKRNLTCSNCNKSGHLKETCFQLHGVPDWYKSLGDKKKKGAGSNGFAAVVDYTPIGPVANQGASATNKADVADMVPEILKLVQHRSMPSDPITNFANFAQYDDEFADCNISDSPVDFVCDICLMAKQSRVPFSLSNSHASKPFDLVHLDVWEPYKTPTILGCNYILTVLDDCSRCLWTYLIKQKSQVPSILSSFCNMALYGETPSYEHLRVFGCLCFATNLDPHKSKFHKQAHKCILLGYAMTQKAYKLYDLDDHATFTSRDVLFHENVFPYATDSSITPPSYSPPVVPICYDDPTLDSSTDSYVAPTPYTTLESHSSTSFPDTSPLVIPTSVPPHNTSPLLRRSHRTIHKPEPGSFAEAVKHPEWRRAMEDEIQALEQNHTWVLTTLPVGKKPIGCKWVFKIKLKADGSVERYKARLVAKG